MTTRARPRFLSLGPGQPPQLPSSITPPPAYCIQCRVEIRRFAPQRPMCIRCWEEYEGQPIAEFRDEPMAYCHGCGEQEREITFGSPLCQDCEEDYVESAV